MLNRRSDAITLHTFLSSFIVCVLDVNVSFSWIILADEETRVILNLFSVPHMLFLSAILEVSI